MSTIPFSTVAQVIPSVLSAGGVALDLNGLLLTQNTLAPNDQVLQFPDENAVSAFFGADSTEYAMAAVYFKPFDGATKKPALLNFLRYAGDATPATLTSGSWTGISLSTLQEINSYGLFITINGTSYTSSTINLNGATSFSDAAAIIQAAFTSPPFTVAFNSTSGSFVFTTTATGSSAIIDYATGNGDPSLQGPLKLTAATGATLSQGSASGNPTNFMNHVIANLTQNWASLGTCWQASTDELEAFAAWTNSKSPRYWYVANDNDSTAPASGGTDALSFGEWLSNNKLSGTTAIYSPDLSKVAFAMGWAASLDFARFNGRTNLCFRSQSGLTSDVTSAAQAANLAAKGYNFYGIYGSNNPANNQSWFSDGAVSGEWLWADSYVNQIWLNASLELALIEVLRNSPSVPYNAQGYGLIHAACLDPINAALNFGAIRTGVSLSEQQKSEIQLAIGKDVTAAITLSGYYLQISPASPITRAARQSPPCTLYYTDGQSIQKLNLASIEVQ